MPDIYLDNAATSHPKPREVLWAVQDALTKCNANPGRSGHRRALMGARILMEGRETLSGLLGAGDPLRVVYQFGCTDAINQAIKGCARAGGHVVATALEHNSVLRVLTRLKDEGTIDFTLAEPTPEGFVPPERMQAAIRENTCLLVMTHASNVLGTIQPVAAVGQIAREAGIPFLVDGAQALGSTPVDVKALCADLYAFPGHKGLLGPQGTGGLYVGEGLRLKSYREGGTGSSSESMRQPDEMPEALESGTLNLPGIAGLNAGALYVLQNQLTIRAHERALCAQLIEGLARIEGIAVYGAASARDRVGAVSFNLGDYASGQIADALNRRGIAVRGGLHCAPGAHAFLGTLDRGAVRASVGYKNTAQDIDLLLRGVWEIAREGV